MTLGLLILLLGFEFEWESFLEWEWDDLLLLKAIFAAIEEGDAVGSSIEYDLFLSFWEFDDETELIRGKLSTEE